jgi:response regulator RpfG family c-di-GMP phosphodiesterase
VYDAITTVRPYHAAMPPEGAFDALENEVRLGWRRADLVETFVRIRRGPT